MDFKCVIRDTSWRAGRTLCHMKKAAVLMIGSALLLAALAGPSGGATSRIRAFGETPTDFHWHPKAKTVVAGTKIVWENATSAVHTVTSYGGGWRKNVDIAAGAKTSFIYSKAGFYKFRCTKHSRITDGKCTGMCGTVKVT